MPPYVVCRGDCGVIAYSESGYCKNCVKKTMANLGPSKLNSDTSRPQRAGHHVSV